MKPILTIAIVMMMAGCKTIDVPKPVITIPPVVIGQQPDKPASNLPPATCKCDTTLPLCDPNPVFYSQAYMDQYGAWEECAIEAQNKIICRFCVIRGSSGGFWMLSSLGLNYVSRAENGTGVCKCFNQDGYSYHVKGYCNSEPQQAEVKTVALKSSGKYIIVECRKAK